MNQTQRLYNALFMRPWQARERLGLRSKQDVVNLAQKDDVLAWGGNAYIVPVTWVEEKLEQQQPREQIA